ncbi:hypothetical protein FWK35_00036880 [Aphis craccivora]|uniref:Uncharacterized protein n=1 Tax=Aphis craccivora TaxID=307492 RepID=A0A6G0Z0E0_APHCR|nr:hypothetical protein FWK35_00036880 [Aphis craccivora]
MNNLTKLLK